MLNSETQSESFEQLAEEFVLRLRKGEQPSIPDYVLRFPQWAGQIHDLFPLLVVCEKVGDAVADDSLPTMLRAEGPKQLGEYRILRWIGQGGMGAVYEAVQESLGRHVALKVLWTHRLSNPILLQRFHVEARAAARLHHTNIVPVFDIGQENGVHYYAMQFIRGQSLNRVIDDLSVASGKRERSSVNGRNSRDDMSAVLADSLLTAKPCSLMESNQPEWPHYVVREGVATPSQVDSTTWDGANRTRALPAETPADNSVAFRAFQRTSRQNLYRNVASIGLQLADALAYAHGQGIVHRDIKPSNILLDTEGRAWITDFGLAKADESDVLTATGDVVGTLRYMSPERFKGQSDVLGDVYGLAVTLYELVTGQPAFQGASHAQLLLHITTRDPVAPRSIDRKVPADLETIILKGMDKSARRRYTSASAMARDFQSFLQGKPIRARRIGHVERICRWARRQPALAALASLLLLTAMAGFPAVTWLWQSAERSRNAETVANTQLQTNLYFSRIAEVDRDLRANRIQRALNSLNNCPEHLRGWEWKYLFNRWLVDSTVLEGHASGEFYSVAACPNSSLFALACGDGSVSIFNAVSGKVELELPRQSANVFSVAFSPNGRYLAAASADGKVRLWQWTSAHLCYEFDGHKGWDYGTSHSVAFSPDGRHLAAGDVHGNVILRDVASGRPLVTFVGSPAIASSVAFSRDGGHLAIARFDGSVTVYRRRAPQSPDYDVIDLLGTIPALPLSDLVFGPNADRLYGSCFDGKIWVWDLDSRRTDVLDGHALQPILGLALSHDGGRLASCGMDRTIQIWDTTSGKDVIALQGHAEMVTSLAFSHDDALLVSTSTDRTARVFSTRNAPPQKTLVIDHGSPVWDAVFDATGERIATAAEDRIVRIYNARTGNALPVQQFTHDAGIFRVSFSRDGTRLASVSGQGASGRALLNIWNLRVGAREFAPIEVESILFDVTFSPDDKYIVAAGGGRIVMVFDGLTGKLVKELTGHQREIFGLSFSDDGTLLASKSNDNVIILWDMCTLKKVRAFPIPTSNGSCVRFSPNGQWLVTGGEHTVDIRDTQSGNVVQSLHGHTDAVWTADFSRDGRLLATSGDDCAIRIWGSGDGDWSRSIDQPICVLRGHTGFVVRVNFSPDGRQMVSASRGDKTVRVWELDQRLLHSAFSAISLDKSNIVNDAARNDVRKQSLARE